MANAMSRLTAVVSSVETFSASWLADSPKKVTSEQIVNSELVAAQCACPDCDILEKSPRFAIRLDVP